MFRRSFIQYIIASLVGLFGFKESKAGKSDLTTTMKLQSTVVEYDLACDYEYTSNLLSEHEINDDHSYLYGDSTNDTERLVTSQLVRLVSSAYYRRNKEFPQFIIVLNCSDRSFAISTKNDVLLNNDNLFGITTQIKSMAVGYTYTFNGDEKLYMCRLNHGVEGEKNV